MARRWAFILAAGPGVVTVTVMATGTVITIAADIAPTAASTVIDNLHHLQSDFRNHIEV